MKPFLFLELVSFLCLFRFGSMAAPLPAPNDTSITDDNGGNSANKTINGLNDESTNKEISSDRIDSDENFDIANFDDSEESVPSDSSDQYQTDELSTGFQIIDPRFRPV